MSAGTRVRLKREWVHAYRKPGAEMTGFVVAISPSREVARVRMDALGDSYVRVAHLAPATPRVRRLERRWPVRRLAAAGA